MVKLEMVRKFNSSVQDFLALSHSLDEAYLQQIVQHNIPTMTAAAWLTISIEVLMILRLFLSRHSLDTPASRVYLGLYLSLICLAGAYLVLQAKPWLKENHKRSYWLQYCFVAGYLLWNLILNSYDLYRNGRGSSLALVTAILAASILIQLRPQHMMLLQGCTFILFLLWNYHGIVDKVNSNITVIVAVVANLLFYVREIRGVENHQKLAEMNAQLEQEHLEGAVQYLRRLQDAHDQTAIYHHDLRHALNLVEQMVHRGNLEKLQSFVSSTRENLDNLDFRLYCKHETTNLVLGSFAQRTAKKEIDFQVQVNLPQSLAVTDTDLCALLSNLLENALHATEKVADNALRHMVIKASIKNEKLIILVENGFSGQVVIKNNRPVPQTNTRHHGFGVQSMIDITERYHGLYAFETEGQLFRAKILLPLSSLA